jgi:hypothetical protein
MTSILGGLVSVATAGQWAIDSNAAIANALGTIIGGLFLSVFYFAVAQKFLRLPRLGGGWILESSISETNYNPFRGMIVRYKMLLFQDGTRFSGTAEKVYESSDRVRVFIGVNRTNCTVEGTIRKSYLGRSAIFIHANEKGEQRSSSWVMEARCAHFGRRMHLAGHFSSTASDASGTASLKRIPVPNRVDEYRGLPLVWFGRLFESLTCRLYRNEWNELLVKLYKLRVTADELWKTHNCHLIVAAMVIAEDRRFYSHGGTDPVGMCRALFKTIFKRKIEGGSTIEQQLVRLLTADHRKSLRRKFKEIALATRVHRVLRKEQISVAYVASAYYGWRMNGIKQAARRLSVNLSDPTPEEAAQLVARIRYPEPRRPSARTSMLIAKRQAWIAREIHARNFLLY